MAGPWEVEQKYFVTDSQSLLDRLKLQNAIERPTEQHIDTYLAHPCRDFKSSDEAFRLRQFNSEACVTYKGKRLTGAVKTRPEIELSIRQADMPQWLEMMKYLGFQPKPEVRKTRRVFSLSVTPQDANSTAFAPFTIALDDVAEIGCFAEIELLVKDESRLNEAKERVESLGQLLGLTDIQPRSYLSLLLAKLGVD